MQFTEIGSFLSKLPLKAPNLIEIRCFLMNEIGIFLGSI